MLNRFTEAQQRMLEMASYLEDLPEERFDMSGWLTCPGESGLSQHAHHHVYVPRNFDEIGLQCGTTACLAGHVVLHYSEETRRLMSDPMTVYTFRGMAARLLDLDGVQAERLFVPYLSRGIGVREYTTRQVARVVRHLALTGKIDWRRAGRAKR